MIKAVTLEPGGELPPAVTPVEFDLDDSKSPRSGFAPCRMDTTLPRHCQLSEAKLLADS